MDVYYLAYYNTSTGEIARMDHPGGSYPPEGPDPDNEELYRLHITHAIEDLARWMETHWVKNGVITERSSPTFYESWDPVNEEWVLNSEKLWKEVRKQRGSKLASTDWTQLRDSNLTAEQVNAWQIYRQDLRDIPYNYVNITDPDDITWPTPPE